MAVWWFRMAGILSWGLKGTSWVGASYFCSIPLLWCTFPQYLDTIKVVHLYEKPACQLVTKTNLHLFLSLTLILPLCVSLSSFAEWVCAVIPLFATAGGWTLWLHCLFVALDGIGHQSSPNGFVRAVSLFSQVRANISLGCAVLDIQEIHVAGWPMRWANKCLDCYFSANLDQDVKLPTGLGRCVYMTRTRSADCGLQPNGHSIFCLLPKPINMLPPGQPQFFRFGWGEKVRVSVQSASCTSCHWLRCRPCPVISSSWVLFDFSSVGGWVNWGEGFCQTLLSEI